MISDFLNSHGIDPGILTVVLAVLVVILVIMMIISLVRMQKIYRRYDIFMRGKDAETLEDKLAEIVEKVDELKASDRATRDVMKVISRNMSSSYQKTGVVKYNAFDGMGGESSFALAMLNQENSGFLLNAMHSRTSCYIYIKEIREGNPEGVLSTEEKAALNIAMEQQTSIYNQSRPRK